MMTCLQASEQHTETLLNLNNVVGTAAGIKWVNGLPTDQPAILVFVEKKLSKKSLFTKFSVDDMIPETLSGHPTDIIEVGKIVKQTFTSKIRPIKAGYSCGHRQVTAGTIGGFFIDRDGDPVVLSNCHVLADEGKAKLGDPIYQPGPADTKDDLTFKDWPDPVANLPYFATLKKFIPLRSDAPNTQDSAIAKINDKIIAANLIDLIYPHMNTALTGFTQAQINMQIQKAGRTTEYTTGRIIAIGGSFTIGYDIGAIRFNQCIVTTPLSKGGDSGSLVIDMNMKAVGLLFAGSPKVTLLNPIELVVNEYGLNLWDHNKTRDTITLSDITWSIYKPADSQIAKEVNAIKIAAPANQAAYVEHKLTSFESIQISVNTGTDQGTIWGPGLVVQWPGKILKINLRHDGTFGGYYNGHMNTTIGKVKARTDYMLRIRKTTNTYIGEVQDNGKWTTIIEIPQSMFPSQASYIRIGKTDMLGGSNPHTALADRGECSFSSVIIK